MNVNGIYSDIASLWNQVYPLILFHIIFFIVYYKIFKPTPIKKKLADIAASSKYQQVKSFMTEIGLWSKLPFFILILSLIYLTVFSSIKSIVCSVEPIPFKFTYSEEYFSASTDLTPEIIEISKYSNDTVPSFHRFNERIDRYVMEYKTKYPDKYSAYVGWLDEKFNIWTDYLDLIFCLTLIYPIIYFVRLNSLTGKRIKIFGRLLLFYLLLIPIIFIVRKKAETYTEERYFAKVNFVISNLQLDDNKKVVLTNEQITSLKGRIMQTYEMERNASYSDFLA